MTEDEIAASGATTLFEALRRTLPGLLVSQGRDGRATGIARRGQSSIELSDRPAVFIDGARIADLVDLNRIPARDVASIRFLNGLDGTTYYGTNSGDGVILVTMKSGRT
ncbi:MAG: TonB-dependent receptor [Longimicrobiales bacterium]